VWVSFSQLCDEWVADKIETGSLSIIAMLSLYTVMYIRREGGKLMNRIGAISRTRTEECWPCTCHAIICTIHAISSYGTTFHTYTSFPPSSLRLSACTPQLHSLFLPCLTSSASCRSLMLRCHYLSGLNPTAALSLPSLSHVVSQLSFLDASMPLLVRPAPYSCTLPSFLVSRRQPVVVP